MKYVNFLRIKKETEINAFTDEIISEYIYIKFRSDSAIMDKAFCEAYEMYNGSIPFISMKQEVICATDYVSVHIPDCDIEKFVSCFKQAFEKISYSSRLRIVFSESVICEVKRG